MTHVLDNAIIADPVTKEKPSFIAESEIQASSGSYVKNAEFGFWDFVPKGLEELNNEAWQTWNKLQENGVASYVHAPTQNLGVGKRQDFLDFATFANFRGMVLDIGCGPQKAPTHIQFNEKTDVTFVGIDPLVGEQPRDFTFVLGLGEYLPFADNTFDQVLYVTSLDHFVDPRVTLREAKRVVKADGEIIIWLGEKDKNAPKPAVSPEWYQKLEIPKGAEDPFHFKRFSVKEAEGYFQEVGLQTIEVEERQVDQWRKNCFYRLKK